MKQIGRLFLLSVLILSMNMFSSQPQDWPQWRGMNRDGKVTGFKAPQTWPQQLNQTWKVSVGNGDATPALVNNKLYVFTTEANRK